MVRVYCVPAPLHVLMFRRCPQRMPLRTHLFFMFLTISRFLCFSAESAVPLPQAFSKKEVHSIYSHPHGGMKQTFICPHYAEFYLAFAIDAFHSSAFAQLISSHLNLPLPLLRHCPSPRRTPKFSHSRTASIRSYLSVT